jgi:hypothetical protein
MPVSFEGPIEQMEALYRARVSELEAQRAELLSACEAALDLLTRGKSAPSAIEVSRKLRAAIQSAQRLP